MRNHQAQFGNERDHEQHEDVQHNIRHKRRVNHADGLPKDALGHKDVEPERRRKHADGHGEHENHPEMHRMNPQVHRRRIQERRQDEDGCSGLEETPGDEQQNNQEQQKLPG